MNKTTNSQNKHLRELVKSKKYREEHKCFVVEGKKIICDLLSQRIIPMEVYISSEFDKNQMGDYTDILKNKTPALYVIQSDIFSKISSLKTSQGIMAVFDKNILPDSNFKLASNCYYTLCDNIQDPGNLGAIIRSSLALNAAGVIFYGNCADPLSPKVIRATSGAIFHIPYIAIEKQSELIDFKNLGAVLYCSSISDANSMSIESLDMKNSAGIFIFGNEGNGISESILEITENFFHINISEKVESLNVGAATAITLFVLNSGRKS